MLSMGCFRGPFRRDARQQPEDGHVKAACSANLGAVLLAGSAVALAVLFGSEHFRPLVIAAVGTARDTLVDGAVSFAHAADPRGRRTRRRERRAVAFRSESDIPVDLYFDDARLGLRMGTLFPKGAALMLSAREGDRFFYTIKGQRERMIDGQGKLVESVIDGITEEVLLTADVQPQGHLCLDRYNLCAQEAAHGLCQTFPGWMIPNCCASCDVSMNASGLLDPAVRCRREVLNTTGSRAWRSGDLQRMFEDIAHSGRWAHYGPVVLSRPPAGPWVLLLEKFLSDDECAAFIAAGELEGFKQSAVQKEKASVVNALGELASSVDSSRTSSTAWCTKAKCGANPFIQQVIHKVEELTGISRANFELPQILSYTPGQHCRAHQDSKQWLGSTATGVRILTAFLYLSNVEAGGETLFGSLGLRVEPKKGAALIWPNVRNEDPDMLDDRVFHESLAVERGLKRAANLWAHTYDVEVAEHWGC